MKKLIISIVNNIPLLVVIIIFLIVLSAFATLGLEIFKAIIEILQKYWPATIICALVIIYIVGKANDRK